MTITAKTPSARALRALLDRLKWYKVVNWSSSSSDQNTDRREVTDIEDADVVSSEWTAKPNGETRHALVIDIDHPAWLIKSSTEGHHHLYVDVPGGIPHETYIYLLGALAQAGVIEQGYNRASETRGHSAVRLPWIKKGQTDG